MEEYGRLGDGSRVADGVMHSNFSKKRKLCFELEDESSAVEELPENEVSPPASSILSGDKCDVGLRRLRSPDVEHVDVRLSDGSGTELSLSFNGFIREGTATRELCGDSEQAKSSTASPKKRSPQPASPRRKIRASIANMPSEEELEEFFAAAETNVRKGFAEKYNYDPVKDIPLEGRYQWVRLHPEK